MKQRKIFLALILTLTSTQVFADNGFYILRSNIKTETNTTISPVKIISPHSSLDLTKSNYAKPDKVISVVNKNTLKTNYKSINSSKNLQKISKKQIKIVGNNNPSTSVVGAQVMSSGVNSFIFSQDKTFINNVKSWAKTSNPEWKVVFSDKDSSNYNFIPSNSAVFTGTFKESLSKLIKVLDKEGMMYKVSFYSNFTAVIK